MQSKHMFLFGATMFAILGCMLVYKGEYFVAALVALCAVVSIVNGLTRPNTKLTLRGLIDLFVKPAP